MVTHNHKKMQIWDRNQNRLIWESKEKIQDRMEYMWLVNIQDWRATKIQNTRDYSSKPAYMYIIIINFSNFNQGEKSTKPNKSHTRTLNTLLRACYPNLETPTSWLLGDRTFFMLSSRFSESTMREDGWGPKEVLWEAFSGVLRVDGLRLGTRLARDLVTTDSTPGFSRLSPLFLISDSCWRKEASVDWWWLLLLIW